MSPPRSSHWDAHGDATEGEDYADPERLQAQEEEEEEDGSGDGYTESEWVSDSELSDGDLSDGAPLPHAWPDPFDAGTEGTATPARSPSLDCATPPLSARQPVVHDEAEPPLAAPELEDSPDAGCEDDDGQIASAAALAAACACGSASAAESWQACSRASRSPSKEQAACSALCPPLAGTSDDHCCDVGDFRSCPATFWSQMHHAFTGLEESLCEGDFELTDDEEEDESFFLSAGGLLDSAPEEELGDSRLVEGPSAPLLAYVAMAGALLAPAPAAVTGAKWGAAEASAASTAAAVRIQSAERGRQVRRNFRKLVIARKLAAETAAAAARAALAAAETTAQRELSAAADAEYALEAPRALEALEAAERLKFKGNVGAEVLEVVQIAAQSDEVVDTHAAARTSEVCEVVELAEAVDAVDVAEAKELAKLARLADAADAVEMAERVAMTELTEAVDEVSAPAASLEAEIVCAGDGVDTSDGSADAGATSTKTSFAEAGASANGASGKRRQWRRLICAKRQSGGAVLAQTCPRQPPAREKRPPVPRAVRARHASVAGTDAERRLGRPAQGFPRLALACAPAAVTAANGAAAAQRSPSSEPGATSADELLAAATSAEAGQDEASVSADPGAYYEISEEDFDRLLQAGELFETVIEDPERLGHAMEETAYEVSEADFERLLLAGALQDIHCAPAELQADDVKAQLAASGSEHPEAAREAMDETGEANTGETVTEEAEGAVEGFEDLSRAPIAESAISSVAPRPPGAPAPQHRQQRPRWERKLPGDVAKLPGPNVGSSGAGASRGSKSAAGGGLFFLPTDATPKSAGPTPSPSGGFSADVGSEEDENYAHIRGQASAAAGSPLHSARLLRSLQTPSPAPKPLLVK